MNKVFNWLREQYATRNEQSFVVRSYMKLFNDNSKQARTVINDLAVFCYDDDTTFVAGDPHQSAINEGRRQVFIHIDNMLSVPSNHFKEKETIEDGRDTPRPDSEQPATGPGWESVTGPNPDTGGGSSGGNSA